MKTFLKTFTLIFALVLTVNTVQAQINFGVRAGVNLANQTFEFGSFSIEPDARVGLTLGVLANIGITEAFSIQPELNFIQKGSKTKEDLANFQEEQIIIFNYLEIPVLAKYTFASDAVDLSLLAGPSLGFGLSGSIEVAGVKDDIDWDEDEVKQGDFGLNFGVGAGFGNFFVDVRYQLGLTNLNDSDDDEITLKNKGINIGVGYMFGG